jgi:large subunit ribosomal protein L11
MIKKKIKAFVKLTLTAGKASPAPPIGPALGQHGVNIAAFCKEYNAKTLDKIGSTIPVKITIYEDKSYNFILKSEPTSVLIFKNSILKKETQEQKKKEKKDSEQKKEVFGSISKNVITKIANYKLQDLNTTNIEKAVSIISGTAKNMKIEIID